MRLREQISYLSEFQGNNFIWHNCLSVWLLDNILCVWKHIVNRKAI